MPRFNGKMFTLFCLVLFILLPKIGVFDLTVLPLSILFLSCFFMGRIKLDVSLIVLFLLLTLVITVLISALLNGNISNEHLLKPIRLAVVVLILSHFFQNTAQKIDVVDIFYVIFIAALINAVVVYAQYAAHLLFGISDFLSINFDSERSTPYRKSGLASGFPTAGLLNVLGVLSLFYLVQNKSIKYAVFLIVLLPVFFITARTSLILGGLSIIVLSFYNRKIFSLVLVMVGFTFIFIMYMLSTGNAEHLMKSFSFAIELFSNFTSGSGFQTQSTNSLLTKHFTIPEDFFTLLIGTSLSTWSFGAGQSDVFFIRVLWGTGVFSLILYIILYCHMWYKCVNSTQVKFDQTVLFLMFFVVFIASFKGAYIYSRFVSDCLLIIFCYICSNHNVFIGRKRYG
ncbi:hypothetical protein F0Z19_4831 [Vibrio cyclitrophicus]|nr:hypothetical protein F0Z19_4831 [Vibrio cyclitrophicus]